MKKILLTIVAVMAAINMSAQVYVGGSIGFGSVKAGAGDSEATYKFIPEVGYNLNDEWAFGAALGYQKGACSIGNGNFTQDVTTEIFAIDAYARYTPWDFDLVKVFFDGGFGFGSIKDGGTLFNFGVKPGVALCVTDKIVSWLISASSASRTTAPRVMVRAAMPSVSTWAIVSASASITTSDRNNFYIREPSSFSRMVFFVTFFSKCLQDCRFFIIFAKRIPINNYCAI